MTIWVVRHGWAGHKREWTGDDDLRPLDERGRRQAGRIAERLAGRGPRRLWSSPTRRCAETLVPLGHQLGLSVRACEGLRVDGYPEGLLALLKRAEPGDVLCTHGEVMRPALAELRRRGMVDANLPRDVVQAKGAVWELDLNAGTFALL
jgi:phosphohistidine phosphatase SixA